MTDTEIPTLSADPAGESADTNTDTGGKNPVIQLLAKALWREHIAAPSATDGGDDKEDGKADRSDWKDRRRDYMKLANKLYKRLDRQGATLTAPAEGNIDESEDADEASA